jgi:hypothetical protein
MHTLKIDNHSFTLPGAWNELTGEQFLLVAALCESRMSLAKFRLTLFTSFTDLRVLPKKEVYLNRQYYFYLAHGITREFLIASTELFQICTCFDFMLQPVDEARTSYKVNYTCIANLLPSFPAPYAILHGPADGLSNLVYAEYIHAETAYDAFLRTGKWEHALRLAAILYRPEVKNLNLNSPEYNGDCREPFNDFFVSGRALKLRAVDSKYITAVLMWYAACRSWIIKRWPEPFEESGPVEKTDVFTGFMKMVTSLANNDVTRTEKVRQSYLYDIMFTLQALAVENKRLNENTKS